MNLSDLRQVLAPLHRRVMNMVARGVIKVVVDSGKVQKVQLSVLAGEVLDGVDRIQEFGFTSTPLPGAQGVLLSLAGSRDHAVVIGTEHGQYRPTNVAAGESCLYNFSGQRIHLKEGSIRIGSSSASQPAVLGTVLTSGMSDLIGQITDLKTQVSSLVTLVNTLTTTMATATPATVVAAIATPSATAAAALPAITTALTTIGTQLASIKSQYLDTAATNIVSQEVFVERSQP
jgi:phage baseplate assembly protein V